MTTIYDPHHHVVLLADDQDIAWCSQHLAVCVVVALEDLDLSQSMQEMLSKPTPNAQSRQKSCESAMLII